MHLLSLTAALLVPLCIQAAVEFTDDSFKGITVGKPFNLTWKGDGTVRPLYPPPFLQYHQCS